MDYKEDTEAGIQQNCYNEPMRTQPFQLPSSEELSAILSHEGQRVIPLTKEYKHYADFSTILALLNEYSLPTEFFDSEFQLPQVASMFAELTKNILETQDDKQKQALFNNLYDYLSESDNVENADIIFVFGSKSNFRIEKAIELYKEGYSKRILISGRGPFYEQDKSAIPEAQRLAKYALENGIPESALILEEKSITIADNVKRSLNMLEELAIPHKSIILVNSPFSQRRGWVHFNKFSAEGTELIRSNVDTVSEQYSRDGWYRDETGTKIIVKEFFGLRMSEILNTS